MTAPTLGGFTTNFGYTENGGAVFIDSDVTLADAEGNWVGGSIVVSGLGATEDIALVGEGNSAGQFYVAGNTVFLQTDIGGGIVIPMPIATITDAGTSFTIGFTANVSTAVVERVLEHLTYSNSSDAPAATERFTVTVTDGAGQVAVGTDFSERPDALDPLNGVNVGNSPFAALVDWDGDGDQDVVATGFSVGAWRFSYLRNNGDGTLTRLTGADNPFGSISGFTPTPAFGDIDGDGDIDMVVGQSDGTFRTWLRGPGGSLTEATGASNPFTGFDVGNFAAAALGDIDGDGDPDLVSGSTSGTFTVYQNNGGSFTLLAGAANPFNGIDIGTFSIAALGDVDGDGDVDLVAGEENGAIFYFRKDAGGYVQQTGAANPFGGVTVPGQSFPGLGDIDGDGDVDLLVGVELAGTFNWYEHNGGAVTVTVTAVNDAPVAEVTGDYTATEQVVLNIKNSGLLVSDNDSASGSVTVTLSVGYGAFNVTAGGTGVGIAGNGTSTVTLTGTVAAIQALLNTDATSIVTYFAGGDNPPASTLITLSINDNGNTGSGGALTSSDGKTIFITPVDDLPVAVADGPSVDADVVTDIPVVDNDTDVDGGPKGVLEINGSAVSIGVPVTLASGATVTLNADGTIGYDPNGVFDDLVSFATALATGASNFSATDSFSYTLNGGSSTTVTVTVFGVDEPGDRLLGTNSINEMNGTTGNDVIMGLKSNDLLLGGDGNDVIWGNDDNDTLSGAAADDRLYGGNGDDNLSGGDGNDVLIGNNGNDALAGGFGDDTYYVGDAGDAVTENSGEGTDLVRTQIDYTLTDNVENLVLSAGARSGTGNGLGNTIWGSGGADTLSGLAGDDTLRGREGRDTLLGGDGEDLIDGGVGKDTLTGGADRDVFQFHDGDMGTSRPLADVITDFSQADAEKIQLGLVDADINTAGDQAFSFIGTGSFTGTAGELRYEVALGGTWISGDTNGDGAADWYIGLTGVHALTSADFVL